MQTWIPSNSRDMKYDVVFVQDATGSQQPYVDATHAEIITISTKLKSKIKPGDVLRFRLIAFRDHPPQDSTFVTKTWDFTTDVSVLKSQINGLVATGGGDGPEAQIDALNVALNSPWADGAKKMVILITDSPPHGIGDNGDEFSSQCPCGLNIMNITDVYLQKSIVLSVIACEPTLSGSYTRAHDFWKALTVKTHGKFLPLGNLPSSSTTHMHHAIVGLALHAFDNHRIADEMSDWIGNEAHRDHSAIAADLHAKLTKDGIKHHQVSGTDVYATNSDVDHNVGVWASAKSISDATSKLRTVSGHRIVEKHRDGTGYSVSYAEEPITRSDVDTIVSKALIQKQQKDVDNLVDDFIE